MRHRGTALLPLAEKFLYFEDLGPLEVAKLGGPAVDARRDERQGGRKLRVPVALDDLRAQGRRPQAEPLANGFFHGGIEVGVGADRTAQLTHRDAFAGLAQAFLGAAELVVHQRELEAEGDRLGMDAVAAPDHRGVLERPRPFGHDRAQRRQVLQQEIAGRRHLHGQGGVEDVRGGQPLVNPPRGRTDVGSHVFKERNHVVLRALLDLVDLVDREPRLRADGLGVLLRDEPGFRERFAGKDFDLQPDRVFALLRPEGTHLRDASNG